MSCRFQSLDPITILEPNKEENRMFARHAENRRPPAVAGQFYPDDPVVLREQLGSLLAQARSIPGEGRVKALIAPHAGYLYSGQTAASTYHTLQPQSEQIERVVLLGPAHRVAFSGLATSSMDFFSTPLGDVPLDRESIQRIEALPQVLCLDRAHQQEHSLEVHLPFLQILLGSFTLVPLVVGDSPPDEVAEVIDALWGGDETLVVISSDLSHFHHYEQAQAMDQRTSRAILDLDIDAIGHDDACGRMPIRGLLKMVRRRGLKPLQVDLCNSGDTSGNRDRVVGYGGYVFRQ
jgi:hypothetical protein